MGVTGIASGPYRRRKCTADSASMVEESFCLTAATGHLLELGLGFYMHTHLKRAKIQPGTKSPV